MIELFEKAQKMTDVDKLDVIKDILKGNNHGEEKLS